MPLTVNDVQSEGLLGGGSTVTRVPAGDSTATRVLNKGEPVPVPRGRADDFSWPRSGIEIDQSALEHSPSPPPAASSPETVGTSTPAAGQQHAGEPKPIQRRGRPGTGEGPLKSLQQIFPGLFRF